MIRFLRGIVSAVTETTVVLDVGGIGFEVSCSLSAIRNSVIGTEQAIPCLLVQNEAGASLFGFGDETERRMFQELLSTKGIGGKMAIAILRILPVQDILTAVSFSREQIFMQVPGVGKRTAERLCFELRDRLEKNGWSFQIGELPQQKSGIVLGKVREALGSLGFSQGDIAAVLARITQQPATSEEPDEESLLRAALRELRKKTGDRRT